MAECEITEYKRIAGDADGRNIQAGFHDANVTVTNQTYTTAESVVLQADTAFIRIKANEAVFFTFNGTATDADTSCEPETPEFFGVVPGSTISVYDGTS